MRVGIVGAGIAGLACADSLAQGGLEVVLFDKGKRPGGRLASVVVEAMSWDLGAQCFTARDPAFAARAAQWCEAGWIAPWPEGPEGALVGVPTMAALVAAQCARHDARFGALVQRVERGPAGWRIVGPDLSEGPFEAVVIAVPAEQAASLISLQDLHAAREAAAVRSTPCWSVMAAFAEPVPVISSLLRDHGPIATAARNRSKPGRGPAECWVLHASAEWSRARLEHPREAIADDLLAQFAAALDTALPATIFAKAHRWRFALPFAQQGASVWNERLRLGACGDWCIGPTVEEAWLSGNALGRRIAATL